MRKLWVIAALIVAAAPLTALEVGDTPAVSVRSAPVKSGPGYLTRVTDEVAYGVTVEVVEVRTDWVRITVPGGPIEGWVHASVIAPKEVLRLEQSSDTAGTTSRELALAGRGFNEQVEAQYQSEQGLDFGPVDEMEENEIPVDALGEFFAGAGLGANLGVSP